VLAGFARVELAPGEHKQVTIDLDQRLLASYDVATHGWHVAPGSYTFRVASDAVDKGVSVKADIAEARLAP
jgi:beta-glucosidase